MSILGIAFVGMLVLADEPKAEDSAYKFTAATDTIYSWNGNHPQSGLNQLHNFDMNADAWSLVSASFGVEREGERFNFRFDSGYGQMIKTMAAGDPWHGPNQYILQAYVGFRPFEGKPLKVEVGKFATPAGGEVPETFNNFNTTRSLLYVLGIPYYHFGVRATAPLTPELSAGVYVVNGWNNVTDNNWGTTYGLTGNWQTKDQAFKAIYFGGVANTPTGQGSHNMLDLVYNYTGTRRWNNYTEFVWDGLGAPDGRAVSYGFGHASRFNASKNWSLSPRVSWFLDRNGASTGKAQRLIEMTGTVEYRVSKWVFARGELRRDISNRQYFDWGDHQSSSKTQDTALVGLTFLWRGER